MTLSDRGRQRAMSKLELTTEISPAAIKEAVQAILDDPWQFVTHEVIEEYEATEYHMSSYHVCGEAARMVLREALKRDQG